jgi:predicted nucleic acid-binding protein
MIACLDADVLIDCLRGRPAARQWLVEHSNDAFVVPGVVAMELIVGCSNKADLQRTQKFLNSFQVIWPEAREFARAYELLAMYRLSTQLSIPDCLIASIAIERSLRLLTFNAKHYRAIRGLDVEEPYKRS